MYSEFTVKLIEEVKKKEILYNTRYDKRPKSEKERAWNDIGQTLNTEPDRCKRHWKNVRDRFVKISNARVKHFRNNGSELDAPHYIYYDMLSFMREFSAKKENIKAESCHSVNMNEIIPEALLSVERENVIVDMTKDFLRLIQQFPVLYDSHSEMRKYRDRMSWKKIADSMYSRFSIGKLRTYWIMLMRKFKMYEEYRHHFYEPIKNEHIFNQMAFVRGTIKTEAHAIAFILDEQFQIEDNDDDEDGEEEDDNEDEDHDISRINKENYIDSLETDENFVNAIDTEDTFEGTEIVIDQEENIVVSSAHEEEEEHEQDKHTEDEEQLFEEVDKNLFEPSSAKKMKRELPTLNSRYVPMERKRHKSIDVDESLDEFDYFGKKVALQLRQIARKNRNVSRKAEIEVLQLLMEFEEHLEKQ